MTANDILNKKFDRATVGGYRADDVNAFMASIAEYVGIINSEKAELENKLVLLADRLEEYRTDEESMRAALLGAQKLGDNIIRDSKAKAESMLEDSVKEAETLLITAKNEAVKLKKEAQNQLEAETYALNKMKREVIRFKKQLMALYQQHMALIERLPSDDNPVSFTPSLDMESLEDDVEDNAPKMSNPIQSNLARVKKAEAPTEQPLQEPEPPMEQHLPAEPVEETLPESNEAAQPKDVFPKRKKDFTPFKFNGGFRDDK